MGLVTEGEARDLFGRSGAGLEFLISRFAELRETPIKVVELFEETHGIQAGAEMRAWMRLFERYELEVVDPAEAELRAPGTKASLVSLVEGGGASWISDLIGYFTASSVIVQQDEMSFLASWAATADGSSKVYYFHPSDWGLWPTDASITARVFRILQEDERLEQGHLPFEGEEEARRVSGLKIFEAVARPEPLPELRDPARLYPRVDWMVHALLGIGRDLRSEVARAAPLEVWAQERAHLGTEPHLATYWLWSHYLFDNRRLLAEALERTAQSPCPVVAETRTYVTALTEGQAKRLGDRDRDGFEALKLELAEHAPKGALDSDARQRLYRRRAEESEENRAEHEAHAALERIAEKEPLVQEALQLLDHLVHGGAIPPGTIDLHGGLDVNQAMDRLAELMDSRFRTLVLARLERAAKVGDTHEHASWGLILAWSAIAEGLDDFERELRRVGTESFGPRRAQEHFRAYGRFSDVRATEILSRGARAWLAEVDDWIRMAPAEPLLQLLKRDTVATHEVIAALLERATFSAANWDICVMAAVAAGELKSKRSVKGLRRAVAKSLGRIDDGGRAKVVRALWSADGANAAAFLRELFERRVADWEAADEDDAYDRQKDVACHLAGLLPMTPDDGRVLSVARVLLGLFLVKLAPERTAKRELVACVEAIFSGVEQGEVAALTDAVAPYRNVRFRETPSTRGSGDALRGRARALCADLGVRGLSC